MYTSRITVRGYELDSFGHVNNSVYLNYLEQARWEILKETGWLMKFMEDKLILAVVEMNIKYIKELKIFDAIVIETEVQRKDPFIIFRQIIIEDVTGISCTKATVKTLLLDDARIPQDIPDGLFED